MTDYRDDYDYHEAKIERVRDIALSAAEDALMVKQHRDDPPDPEPEAERTADA
jgi:hypothetical protein